MSTQSPQYRKGNMKQVKSYDTKPERLVRSWLFSRGYRYWKNKEDLPGKPDIVIPKYKTVIFVNGCFWHQHQGCPKGKLPKTNLSFWGAKLSRNIANDKASAEELRQLGWKVITVWECQLDNKDFEDTMHWVEEELQTT